ncbi:MAG: hypothetical protein H0U87_11105 [Acidobacteria bacterium]|nr:hypothetical protein [Acidobacteriota bacterium]
MPAKARLHQTRHESLVSFKFNADDFLFMGFGLAADSRQRQQTTFHLFVLWI